MLALDLLLTSGLVSLAAFYCIWRFVPGISSLVPSLWKRTNKPNGNHHDPHKTISSKIPLIQLDKKNCAGCNGGSCC